MGIDVRYEYSSWTRTNIVIPPYFLYFLYNFQRYDCLMYHRVLRENRFAGNSSLMEIFDNILERDFLK